MSCQSKGPAAYFLVTDVGLEVPRLPGWAQEASTHDKNASGIVLRLVRTQAVTGSPRIDVVVEPRAAAPTQIEDFLKRNLREMSVLERSGSIRIDDLEQRPVSVGTQRGYRIRHEYVLTSGEAAITQVSTFLVLNGRGVAVTAVGRTELFTPLAKAVDAVLSGLRFASGQAAGGGNDTPAVLKPIDLGKLGGTKNSSP